MTDADDAGTAPEPSAEEAIRQRSQAIWEREGRPEGCALDHWVRAREELAAEMAHLAAARRPEADDAAPLLLSTPAADAASPVPVAARLTGWLRSVAEPAAAPPPNTVPLSIIAAGFVLRGDVETTGEIQIEGLIEGAVTATGVVVGAKGVVEGDIVAETATIHGCVEGSLEARRLVLCANARLTGDVACETLTVMQGARLDCTFRHLAAVEAEVASWQAELSADAAIPVSRRSSAA